MGRLAARALAAPAACVWRPEIDDHALLDTACVSEDLARRDFLRAARWLSQVVTTTGEGYFLQDLAGREDLPGASDASGMGLRACVAWPVRAPDGSIVGVLCLGDVRPRSWTLEERDLLVEMVALAETEVALRSVEREVAAVRAQLHQYELAVAQASEVVWCLRIRPDRRGEIVYFSPNAAGLMDISLLEGSRSAEEFSALVFPDDVPTMREFLDRVYAGASAEAEMRIIDPGGRPRWVWVRARPRREGGELFSDGVTREITDIKRVDEMRTQFLAIAGHELRTPLSVIKGYAEVVKPQVVDRVVVHRQVAAIERRAGELELLVQDFFDLAKLESDQVDLALSDVQVDVLVREAVADHAAVATEEGVVLVQAAARLTTLADPVRLRQVLDNLVRNAIRHTSRGGEVRITCDLRDDAVLLAVENDGPEVDADEIPRLFERFYRGASGSGHDVPGTGLGLAVVRAIAHAHGGEARARSLPGRGMRFEVRLPAGGAEQAEIRSGRR